MRAARPAAVGATGEKFLDFVATGALPQGYAAADHVGLLWRDGELADAVSEEPGRQAFRVSRDGDRAVEVPLEVRFLG